MSSVASDLPTFSTPPVVEVALAAQFEPLERLRAVDLGAVADAFADEYPIVEEHPAKPPMPSGAGGLGISIDVLAGPGRPSLWLIAEGGDRLVQFQHDRLVVNWRRRPGDSYPRYEDAVRPMFEDAWRRLEGAVAVLGIGPLRPNVCEVVYVNVVESDTVWRDHGQLDRVISPWSGESSDDFLPAPAEVQLSARYEFPESGGSLDVAVSPIRRADDGQAAFMLQLVSRSVSGSPSLDGVLGFFDSARALIVKGFVSFTEPKMHETWGMS